MLSSGLPSCVRLRRSSRGGVMYGTACYVKSGSGGQVGVSLVMLCYVSLRRSCYGLMG